MSEPVRRRATGSATAAKAKYISERHRRSLIFFVQSFLASGRSTKQFCESFLAAFPERIGTPAMHAFGCSDGTVYNASQVEAIRRELPGHIRSMKRKFPLKGEFESPERRLAVPYSIRESLDHPDQPDLDKEWAAEKSRRASDAARHPESYRIEDFKALCREYVIQELPEFLQRLCTDPRFEVVAAEESVNAVAGDREEFLRDKPGSGWAAGDFDPASMRCFRDVVGALFDFQKRYEEQAEDAFVETTITREVWRGMGRALSTGRMTLIQGGSGLGKSAGLKAWLDMHRGEARGISLEEFNSQKSFFLSLVQAFDVEHSEGLSVDRMKNLAVEFLANSRLALAIDESQYLWPQGQTINKHPAFINWLITACANRDIPVIMVATERFTERRRRVERQTDWDSFQLQRRIRDAITLPAKPTQEDLFAVSKQLLPEGTQDMLKLVVGYAMASGGFMQAIVDTVDDARLIARDVGRERVTPADLVCALKDWRGPSDAAQKRIFGPEPALRDRGSAAAAPLPQGGETEREAQPATRTGPALGAGRPRHVGTDENFTPADAETNRLGDVDLAGV